MENLIEEIRQTQIKLLKDNNEIDPNLTNQIHLLFNYNRNTNNINSNKSQQLNIYSNYNIKYQPILQKKNVNIANKKTQKEYETYIIDDKKDNSNIDNLKLIDIINNTKNEKFKDKRNLNEYLFNKNKTLLWYEILSSYDSFNTDKKNEPMTKKTKKRINYKSDEIIEELNKMHESIIKKQEMMNDANKKIDIKNYQDVLDNIMKQIEMTRKERKIENYIFQKRIELIEENLMNNKYLRHKTPKKELIALRNLYFSKKSKNKYMNRFNKFNTAKKEIKNKAIFTSYNKNRNNSYINNIHTKISYSINKYNYSFNKTNKILPKYLRKKLKEENKKNIYIRKKTDFQFYKKIMNEIKKLNRENELIVKRYKNLPISNEEFNKIIIRKFSKTGINKEINYRRNKYLIKNNIKVITRKIIDDLLYECIYDLMFIETEKSDKNNKMRLISGFNNIRDNLNLVNKQEQIIIDKYKNILKQKESQSFKYNYNLIPLSPRKKEVKIDENIIKRLEDDKYKILETMLFHGCFYSDFNIFEIYDEFVDEQIQFILEDEINYIVNKSDLLVEKLCNEEFKRAEEEINDS